MSAVATHHQEHHERASREQEIREVAEDRRKEQDHGDKHRRENPGRL
jgi:hypothetical protein